MLRVIIKINFDTIVDTHVVRVKGGTSRSSMNAYRLPDGRTFKHRYGDGAVKCAIKLLRRTQEPS